MKLYQPRVRLINQYYCVVALRVHDSLFGKKVLQLHSGCIAFWLLLTSRITAELGQSLCEVDGVNQYLFSCHMAGNKQCESHACGHFRAEGVMYP